MFERYTEKARRSIFFARYEASVQGSPQIGTEHLLLGLVREDRALLGPDPSFESLREWVDVHTGPRGEKISTSVDLPLSGECKSALLLGAKEADKLGHDKIATAHLLLGIIDQEGCLGAAALRDLGVTADSLRSAIASKPLEAVPPNTLAGLLGTARADLLGMQRGHWGTISALFAPANREAGQSYFRAQGAARKLGSPCLETKHLLLALVEGGFDVQGIFGLNPASVRKRIKPEPPRREHVSVGPALPTDELRKALAYALEEAEKLGDKHLGPGHLVLGLLREEAGEASEILRANGLSLDEARRAVAASRNRGSGSEGSHYV
jgi:ATP-dependent Clp protease ATP-binding subunit ClpA